MASEEIGLDHTLPWSWLFFKQLNSNRCYAFKTGNRHRQLFAIWVIKKTNPAPWNIPFVGQKNNYLIDFYLIFRPTNATVRGARCCCCCLPGFSRFIELAADEIRNAHTLSFLRLSSFVLVAFVRLVVVRRCNLNKWWWILFPQLLSLWSNWTFVTFNPLIGYRRRCLGLGSLFIHAFTTLLLLPLRNYCGVLLKKFITMRRRASSLNHCFIGGPSRSIIFFLSNLDGFFSSKYLVFKVKM